MDFKSALQAARGQNAHSSEPSQLYKRFLFQDFCLELADKSPQKPGMEPIMAEFCQKVRADPALEFVFRKLVEESLAFNVENALFYADKLISLTGEHPVATYLLGESYFLAEEYVKVGYVFTHHDVLTLNENFAILAAKGFMRTKDYAQVLKVLTAPFKNELKNRIFATEIATLSAKAQKFLENRQEAELGFLSALKADPANYAAFDGLCETRQVEDKNLFPTLETLDFSLDSLWVKKFYQTQVEFLYEERTELETHQSLAGTHFGRSKDESPISDAHQMQLESGLSHFPGERRVLQGNYLSNMNDQRFTEDPHGGRQKPGSAVHASPEIKKATFKFGLGRDSEIPGVRRDESISNPEEARANDVMKRLKSCENVHYLYLKLCYHFKNFQINNAHELCKKILEKNQFHFETVILYCEIMVEKEEIAELFSYSSRMAESFPEHYVTYHIVGMYYFYLKKYDAARRYFNKAIHVNTYSLHTWLMLGHTYAAQEESDPASNVYRSALKLFPNSHLPHVYIGMEYLRINNLKTAAIAFNHAKKIAGDNPMIYNEIGCIHLKQKKYDLAKKSFKKALRICRSNGLNWLKHSILNNLANVHRKEKDYNSSIQCYEQSLALCPNDPAVLFSLAFCYNLTGELAKAASLYHKVISRKYDSHFVNHLLSKCMEDLAQKNFDSLR